MSINAVKGVEIRRAGCRRALGRGDSDEIRMG